MNKLLKLFSTTTICLAGAITNVMSLTLITSCSESNVIDILYTNDTHTVLENDDNGINWAKLKAYRNSLEAKGHQTLLVDAGDFSSGGIYGTLSKGMYPIQLMKLCKYDLVVPGNHEFDYGFEQFNYLIRELDTNVISSNFYHLKKDQTLDKRVFDDTKTFKFGDTKIGFVGVTTPSSLTASNPKTFQDEDGNFAYTFLEGEDDSLYYSTIQQSIDSLRNNDCDYVIALTHLGIDMESNLNEFTSNDLIAKTSGLDAVIDGHSHTYFKASQKMDKDNNPVWLTQTGTGLQSVGHLEISKETMSFELLDTLPSKVDIDTYNKMNEIKQETDDILNEKIGEIGFDLTIDKNGKRAIRSLETNLGDFVADSFSFAISSEEEKKRKILPLSIVNGGGIRKTITQGDVTIRDIISVSSFGNTLVKIKVTGQQIFDALEYSVYKTDKEDYADNEFGGFLQVSDGIKFDVNTSQQSLVKLDDKQNWDGYKEGTFRRVSNVFIKDSPLELKNEYELCGSTYILLDGGNGYKKIFENAEVIPIDQVIDYDALKSYFEYCYDNKAFDPYINPQNRINI